jgi:hypothetical protein
VECLNAKISGLFRPIRVNFNPISVGLSSFEQTSESHAIANTWINRRELASERETVSKALRLRRWKREKAKFRFAVGPHGTLLRTGIEIDG